MTENAVGGVVFDRGALIGFAYQRPYPLAMCFAAVQGGDSIVVPAAALAEARAALPVEQHDILDVLLGMSNTVDAALNRASHAQVAAVLAASPDAREALSGAHVVAEALARDYPVLTDRGSQLQGLDPRVTVDELP